ncbi:hypothetical protein Tco_0637613 [Tanacetum coccineum]
MVIQDPKLSGNNIRRSLQGEQSNSGLDHKLVGAVCQKVMKMMNGKSLASTSGVAPGFMHHADLLTKKVVAIGKGLRCLYTCTSLNPTASSTSQNSAVNAINVFDFLNNPVVSNFVHHNVDDLLTLHARLRHLSVSKMIHVNESDIDASNVSDMLGADESGDEFRANEKIEV